MPIKLTRSAAADVVSNVEAQLARARALTDLLGTYHETRHPQTLAEIVRQVDRLRLLNGITTDLLFSIECTLGVINANGKGEETASA